MIYSYSCHSCEKVQDIVKSVSDFDRDEFCTACNSKMERVFTPPKIYLGKTAVEDAYFHPAIGQVVKGDSHASRIAKDRGWIEVGNERPEKHLKPNQQSWDDD